MRVDDPVRTVGRAVQQQAPSIKPVETSSRPDVWK